MEKNNQSKEDDSVLEKGGGVARVAQVSCMVGGTAGALLGFLLLGIAIVADRVFNAPLISRALIEQYWWAFPAGIGVLGYIGLYIFFLYAYSKDRELEKKEPGRGSGS